MYSLFLGICYMSIWGNSNENYLTSVLQWIGLYCCIESVNKKVFKVFFLKGDIEQGLLSFN